MQATIVSPFFSMLLLHELPIAVYYNDVAWREGAISKGLSRLCAFLFNFLLPLKTARERNSETVHVQFSKILLLSLATCPSEFREREVLDSSMSVFVCVRACACACLILTGWR